MTAYVAKERLYLNEDRSEVVPEGHADARWLLAFKGDTVDDEVVKRYGLGAKQRPKPADKQRKPAANKAKKSK